MGIMQVSQLDMTALRQTIAKVFQFPPNKVLDGETLNNVTTKAPYIVVKQVSSNELGANSRYDGDLEKETVTATTQSTISIQFYGNGSREMATFLKTALNSTLSVRAFHKIGVSVLQCTQVLSLPTAMDSGLEQRAQFDMTIGHNSVVKTSINRIENQPFKFEVKR